MAASKSPANTSKQSRRAAASAVTKRPASKQAAGAPSVKRFRAQVERGQGSVCAIHVPFDVEKAFGARGRVPVRGTLNGAPFRGSLFPMGGRHFFVVNRRLREAADVSGGETVPVTIERDTEPRVITPPADLADALAADEAARSAWEKLSYTHRREHVEHVEDAKRPETRRRRIEKSVALLAAGKKEPR
jgi:hypothetical protein